jgi:hypothetical protein
MQKISRLAAELFSGRSLLHGVHYMASCKERLRTGRPAFTVQRTLAAFGLSGCPAELTFALSCYVVRNCLLRKLIC